MSFPKIKKEEERVEGIETEGTVRIPYLLCLHGERKRGVLEHNGRGLLLVLSVYCSSLRPPPRPPHFVFPDGRPIISHLRD